LTRWTGAGLPLDCAGVLLLLCPPLVSAGFTGPVVSVLDGDTIEALYNTHPERVRLSGIDCPEKGHAFGTRAKQAASALVFGRDVMLDTHGRTGTGAHLPM
jgi:micrococcal nuclease